MKIGVISDTHDNVEDTVEAVQIFQNEAVERIFHLGDWCSPFMLDLFGVLSCPVLGVFGNNDAGIAKNQHIKPENIEFQDRFCEIDLNGKSAALLHGDPPALVTELVESRTYDIVIHGHSHLARFEEHGGVLVLNPGSMVPPYGGRQGWVCPSVAIFETTSFQARLIEF